MVDLHVNKNGRSNERQVPVFTQTTQQRETSAEINMWLILIVAALLSYLANSFLKMRRALKHYPPGPPRLPLVGSLPFMWGTMLHLQAERWSHRYGPMVGLQLGPGVRMVVVTGEEEVTALLRHEHCQGRPTTVGLSLRTMGRKGLIFSDGPYWVEQRRFSVRQLRDLGLGKASLEGVMMEELLSTLKFMEDTGPVVEPNELFTMPMLNVLWCIVSGKTFRREDPTCRHMVAMIERIMGNRRLGTAPCDVWPFLGRIAPQWSGYNDIYLPVFEMQAFFRKEVEEQRRADNNSFMSIYLREIQKAPRESGFSEDSLIMICLDLFVAGGDTSSNTLSFALMYLSLYPEVQTKAREELNTVIGAGKIPTLDDRVRLPYLEAVFTEIIRINPIAPLTPPHVCTEDVHHNGYVLPKGTLLMMSLYSVMHNKERWGDPENFRPERFLDDSGNFVRHPSMFPFSMGKRVCIGEPLANRIMFLFLGGLLSRFWFRVVPGTTPPSTSPVPGLSMTPKPFKICAEPIK